MKNKVEVTIDGEQFVADEDQTVLQAILDKQISIPHICYHESLGSIETCDTCAVSINGEIKRACGTYVRPGMNILTDSDEAKAAQLMAMDTILENHELYCTVCDNNNGDCEIHNTVRMMGMEHQLKEFKEKPYETDHGIFYRYDPDQCILCGRCVDVCQTVEVNETLSIDWELERPRVIWDDNVPIDQSSCVSCGQCVTVCPCNALMENSMLGEAGYLTDLKPGILRSMIETTKNVETGFGPLFAVSDSEANMRKERIKKTKTVCTYCGIGCSFNVWTKDREILQIEPTPESPANGISTCIKGKFGWGHINSKDRLTKPLIREGDSFKEVEWETALSYIAHKFSEIRAENGPDALGFIASSKATNEESYLLQKFARQVIGTNNIDNCSRYCQAPATKGLFRTVGYGGDSGSMEDIESADLVIMVGSNTAEAHPVLASKIKRAHKLFGQKLIVADLRRHEMAQRADLYLHPNPGTDLVWLSALTKYIIDQEWHDKDFILNKVNGFPEYVASLEEFTLEKAEEITGIKKEMLIQTAEEIHRSDKTSICWAMGVTQHQIGSDTSTAISNLLLITGNYGRPGTGGYPLRGHNNVQGASDFGSMPDKLPGYQDISDQEAMSKFEKAWGTRLPVEKGLDNHTMIKGIYDGKLKALYITGEDTGVIDSNINYVTKAFEKLEFFVVQDMFLTDTAQYADVVLPASPSLEKEGTFTNTERRIQRLYQALQPLGDSKPDWEIYTALAKKLGFDWDYESPKEIMDEAASLSPMFAGVRYDRLEGFNSLLWPVAEDGKDTPLLYTEEFHTEDGRAKLYPLGFEHHYHTTDEHPIHVNNGRILEHFHEGNMTYHTEGIARKAPNSWIEISGALAKEFGIEEGAKIRLKNDAGETPGRVHITDDVTGKELYVPLNDNGKSAVNFLTDNSVDKDTDTPAYKEVAVQIEIEEVKGKSPLPKFNYRRGHRNPQPGVEVGRKWQREDYTFPGDEVKQDG